MKQLMSTSLKTKLIAVPAVFGLLSTNAFAHSDYWRCAVASGSASAVEANCGTRSDYDARQAEQSRQDQERRDYEQRQQDEQRRRDQDQRDEEDRRRRADDEQRRQEEERQAYERSHRNDDRGSSNSGSYDNDYSYSTPVRRSSRRSHQRSEPVYVAPAPVPTQAYTVALPINAVASAGRYTLAAADVTQYAGSRLESVTVQIATRAPATVQVLMNKKVLGTLKMSEAGTYAKTFKAGNALISAAGPNVEIVVKGEVTVVAGSLQVK